MLSPPMLNSVEPATQNKTNYLQLSLFVEKRLNNAAILTPKTMYFQNLVSRLC